MKKKTLAKTKNFVRTLCICALALISLMVIWIGSVVLLSLFMYDDWRVLFVALAPAGAVAGKILSYLA